MESRFSVLLNSHKCAVGDWQQKSGEADVEISLIVELSVQGKKLWPSVIFAIESWKGAAVTGIVLSSIGSCLISHSTALLVSLLRSRLRPKVSGGVFGLIQTLQCVATLVLLPPMSSTSRAEPNAG
ncbi:hypothetical protein DL764_000214 [Monosporascus ibericus]|uniref:Uncharacterized protein n=1 Tax=Monosporascus ibericus TaxID=155417 RepID=A0A4Q4TZQ3_9PEZI|nr:hypothetical protein DL764_000214 [Monosporascus ibericus]